jgi:hypothetical protein
MKTLYFILFPVLLMGQAFFEDGHIGVGDPIGSLPDTLHIGGIVSCGTTTEETELLLTPSEQAKLDAKETIDAELAEINANKNAAYFDVHSMADAGLTAVTDSVVWIVTSVVNKGDKDCDHVWVDGPTSSVTGFHCPRFHNGFHCPLEDVQKERVCEVCKRDEIVCEIWYQHGESKEVTRFEFLKNKVK